MFTEIPQILRRVHLQGEVALESEEQQEGPAGFLEGNKPRRPEADRTDRQGRLLEAGVEIRVGEVILHKSLVTEDEQTIVAAATCNLQRVAEAVLAGAIGHGEAAVGTRKQLVSAVLQGTDPE